MKLYLAEQEKQNTTQMQLSIMEQELKVLNDKYPLKKEEFDIKTIYSIKTDEGAESYIYIRNNTSKQVSLENFPVYLKKNDNIIARTIPDFKILGYIPEYSGAAFRVEFKNENIYEPNFIEKAQVYINGDLLISNTLISQIENLPENMDYYQKEFLDKVFNSLKYLKKNTFDIHLLKLSEDENYDLNISILIRNGYTEIDIVIEEIPVKIYNENNILIYSGSFKTEDLIIKKSMSKLFNIVLPRKHLIARSYTNYTNLKLKFE